MKTPEENTEPENTVPFPDPEIKVEDVSLLIPEHLDDLKHIVGMDEAWEEVDKDMLDVSFKYMSAILRDQFGEECGVAHSVKDKDACENEEQIEAANQAFAELAAKMPGDIQDRCAVYATACYLYEAYCVKIGQVDRGYNALPRWDRFAKGIENKREVMGWIAVGQLAVSLKFTGYRRGFGLGQQSIMGVMEGMTPPEGGL